MKALMIAIVLAFGGIAHGDGSNYQLPTMTEVPHDRIPPLNVPPPEPQADRTPVIVGAGLVAMAGLFWWSARRRARIDHEEDSDER